MPDKNYHSYELLKEQTIANGVLVPDDPKLYNDTMKVWKCVGTRFVDFYVVGSREDVLDVGRESIANLFQNFRVKPTGQYVLTCKGGSHVNMFTDWVLEGHGTDVDFEFGNWHSLNFEVSYDNVLQNITTTDGSPITYCYRWGCKPTIVNTKARHLWWRSIGLTVYWWGKYIAHRILHIPDNF